MIECLNNIDKVLEERKDYTEATWEMCEDVRMENLNIFKMIKKERNKLQVFLKQEISRESNIRTIIYRAYFVETRTFF